MTLAERVRAFIDPPQKADLAVVEQKAAFGAGAYAIEYNEPLDRHRRDPQKWMRNAQALSRRNPWVNTAEGIITGKGSTVGWHLENPEGETIDPEAAGPASTALAVLERPNREMTRSRLWSITLRHMGVCGNAFWYLDQRDRLAGTPLQVLYINPARMRPATDKGGYLTGWVLDAEDTYEFEAGRQTGIPLDVAEVVHFTLEPPDWGYLGHGLVEAAENLITLNASAERYLTQVLATGGRRGHFIGPKDGRMDDDVFQALVNGLRNVAESPDAAKRNIVTKGPIETTPQAVTPNEVGAMGVLTEMRENIVSGVWKVPLSQLGVPLPAGLNSGDARKYDEASLWQNAIEPRLRSFAETLQFHLLDRWKVLGTPVDLVLDLPEFDDRQPAWELLAKSESAPVTWNEQRSLVGYDPLPDYLPDGTPLGVRITMPARITTVATGPDVTGNFLTPPEPTAEPEPPVGKATVSPLGNLRGSLETSLTPKLRSSVAGFLASQKRDLLERLAARSEHLLRKPGDTSWWSQSFWDAALARALAPQVTSIASTVGGEAQSLFAQKAAPDEFLERVEAFVAKRTGERITGINLTTRDAILGAVREAVTDATKQGLGPPKAADLIQAKVSDLTTWNDERAELIGRTELMNAYNDAALHSYREYDVETVEALDGDADDVCATRNGKRYPIDEAFGISDHPNGTLDWVPVVGKASVEVPVVVPTVVEVASTADLLTATLRAMTQPPIIEIPPTVVNVDAPIVNLPAPQVTVKAANIDIPAPIVNVPAPIVNVAAPDMTPVAKMIGELKDVLRRPVTKEVTARDKEGRILRVKET